MRHVYGIKRGLKPSQLKQIENLYRRRIPPELLISPELRRDVCLLSWELNRQIGLLIDRLGRITHVLVVFILSSLGSVAGTFLGGVPIFTSLFGG